MIKRVCLTGALCLLFSSAAARAQVAADEGAAWRWLVIPNSLQVGLALGEHASSAKVGSSATVECKLAGNGRPSECKVIEETADSGMGDAVLEIAKFYKAASTDETGKPTAGRRAKFSFAVGGNAGPTG